MKAGPLFAWGFVVGVTAVFTVTEGGSGHNNLTHRAKGSTGPCWQSLQVGCLSEAAQSAHLTILSGGLRSQRREGTWHVSV